MKQIVDILKSKQDLKYRQLQFGIIPNINPDTIIGVRTPELKEIAKSINGSDLSKEFLNELPHQYFEENQLHAFIISLKKDYKDCLSQVELFLPYIDNWATCDQLCPKAFNKNKNDLLIKIKKWLKSKHTYTVRFAIKMLMSLYLDKDFKEEYLKLVSEVKSEEYYINMMIAWYFATALAKQYAHAIKYIEENKLSPWVHNKTIQKSVESFRITNEQKKYLKTLKISK